MHRWTRFIAAALIAIMVAGCATGPLPMSSHVESIKPTEGVMLVKLISVQPISFMNPKWRSIKIKNKQTDEVIELADVSSPFGTYSLFLKSLPAGQYEISGFDAAGAAPAMFGIIPALIILAMTSDSSSTGSQPATFTVKPGELTNLGMIVSALPETKEDTMKLAVISDSLAQSSAFGDLDVEAADRIRKMPVRAWDKPADPAASEKALGLVKSYARVISTMDASTDNRVAIGSQLGMVHVRNTNGSWASMSVGTLDTITYVRFLDNGRIFAASDTGKYFVSTSEGNKWQQLGLGNSGYRIAAMEPLGTAGYAFLAPPITMSIHQPFQPKVFFKQKLESEDKAKELVTLDGWSAVGKLPMFYNGEELLVYLNHPGISRTADVHRIHAVTHEKKRDNVPYWATDLYRIPDGGLVLERMNGMSIYNSFSSDNGKTWVHNESSGPLSTRFIDSKNGYGVTKLSTNWADITVTLSKTTDGGKTWTDVGTPFGMSGLMPLRIVGNRIFIFTSTKLLSTADEGKTWQTEWPIKQ